MASPPAFLPLGVVAPVLFALATSVLLAVLYPRIRAKLLAVSPHRRRRLLLALVFGPVVGASALTILAFSPSLIGVLWPALDHCQLHGPATHPHLCLIHPPARGASAWAFLVVGAVLGAALLLALQQLLRLVVASTLVRRLSRFARHEPTLDAEIFESRAPVALTVGALDRRVLLSTGLVDGITAQQLAIVMAHERHHASSNDPFWRGVAAFAAVVHLPWTRRLLLADLHLATEQACDEAAAELIGSRPLVARTILEVSRRLQGLEQKPQPAAVAFALHHVIARVESLLVEPPAARSGKTLRWLWLMPPAAVVLAEPFHHYAETLLGILSK